MAHPTSHERRGIEPATSGFDLKPIVQKHPVSRPRASGKPWSPIPPAPAFNCWNWITWNSARVRLGHHQHGRTFPRATDRRHGQSPRAEPSGRSPAACLRLLGLDRLELGTGTPWASSPRSDIPQGNGLPAPARAQRLNHQAGARRPAFACWGWIAWNWRRVRLESSSAPRRQAGQRIARTGQSPTAEPWSPIPPALHSPGGTGSLGTGHGSGWGIIATVGHSPGQRIARTGQSPRASAEPSGPTRRRAGFICRNWITRHWPRVRLGHHPHGRTFHPGQRIAGTARARGLNHQAGARRPAFTCWGWIAWNWHGSRLGHHPHGRTFHPGQRIAGTGQSPRASAEPSGPTRRRASFICRNWITRHWPRVRLGHYRHQAGKLGNGLPTPARARGHPLNHQAGARRQTERPQPRPKKAAGQHQFRRKTRKRHPRQRREIFAKPSNVIATGKTKKAPKRLSV